MYRNIYSTLLEKNIKIYFHCQFHGGYWFERYMPEILHLQVRERSCVKQFFGVASWVNDYCTLLLPTFVVKFSVHGWFACMHVYIPHWTVPAYSSQKKRTSFSEPGVTDSWELLCGCWELNSGSLKEQPGTLNLCTISPASGHAFWSVNKWHGFVSPGLTERGLSEGLMD